MFRPLVKCKIYDFVLPKKEENNCQFIIPLKLDCFAYFLWKTVARLKCDKMWKIK